MICHSHLCFFIISAALLKSDKLNFKLWISPIQPIYAVELGKFTNVFLSLSFLLYEINTTLSTILDATYQTQQWNAKKCLASDWYNTLSILNIIILFALSVLCVSHKAHPYELSIRDWTGKKHKLCPESGQEHQS